MREPRWHRLAVRDLEKLHWRTAAKTDAAIQELASTGAGVLRKIDVDGRTELRLYVAPFFAWIQEHDDVVYLAMIEIAERKLSKDDLAAILFDLAGV